MQCDTLKSTIEDMISCQTAELKETRVAATQEREENERLVCLLTFLMPLLMMFD